MFKQIASRTIKMRQAIRSSKETQPATRLWIFKSSSKGFSLRPTLSYKNSGAGLKQAPDAAQARGPAIHPAALFALDGRRFASSPQRVFAPQRRGSAHCWVGRSCASSAEAAPVCTTPTRAWPPASPRRAPPETLGAPLPRPPIERRDLAQVQTDELLAVFESRLATL